MEETFILPSWWLTNTTGTTGSNLIFNNTNTIQLVCYGPVVSNQYISVGQPRSLTGEEIQRFIDQEEDKRDARRRETVETWREAQGRAQNLLLRLLTDEQRTELLQHNHFTVTAPSGRRYRICRGEVQNVIKLSPSGQPIARLCAHPPELVPIEDTMIAQKLMLEGAEDQFLAIAHRQPLAA